MVAMKSAGPMLSRVSLLCAATMTMYSMIEVSESFGSTISIQFSGPCARSTIIFVNETAATAQNTSTSPDCRDAMEAANGTKISARPARKHSTARPSRLPAFLNQGSLPYRILLQIRPAQTGTITMFRIPIIMPTVSTLMSCPAQICMINGVANGEMKVASMVRLSASARLPRAR